MWCKTLNINNGQTVGNFPDGLLHWSTDKVTGNNDEEVETRTTYSYISNVPANVEAKTGVARTISSNVNANYAGSNAIFGFEV